MPAEMEEFFLLSDVSYVLHQSTIIVRRRPTLDSPPSQPQLGSNIYCKSESREVWLKFTHSP